MSSYMSDTVFLAILVSTLVVPLLFSLLLYKSVIKKHIQRKKMYLQQISNTGIVPNIQTIFMTIVNKTFENINNYFIYQIISKLVDIWGVGFTILTIVSLNSINGEEIQLATSVVAAILVIAAVYVNPITRAKEYLYAWRQLEPQTFKIIANLNEYQDDSEKLQTAITDCIALSEKVESSLNSEES